MKWEESSVVITLIRLRDYGMWIGGGTNLLAAIIAESILSLQVGLGMCIGLIGHLLVMMVITSYDPDRFKTDLTLGSIIGTAITVLLTGFYMAFLQL